jgi:hypothetical protein
MSATPPQSSAPRPHHCARSKLLKEITEYLQDNSLLSQVNHDALTELNEAYANTETRELATTRDRILPPATAARILCSMATHTTSGSPNGAPTTVTLEEIAPEMPAATAAIPLPATINNEPVNENSLLGIKRNGIKVYPGRVSRDRKYKLWTF